MIRLLIYNIDGLGNASTKPIRHKLDTLSKILHNGEVSILGLAEVNIDWRKVPLKENLYNQTDGYNKTCRISIAHNKKVARYGPLQSGGAATIAMNEIACCVLDSRKNSREI